MSSESDSTATSSETLSSPTPSSFDMNAAMEQLKAVMVMTGHADAVDVTVPSLDEGKLIKSMNEMNGCIEKIRKLNERLDGLMDMSEFDSKEEDDGTVESEGSEDAEVTEEEADGDDGRSDMVELAGDSERKLLPNSIFVTEADLIRISNALKDCRSVDEWISRISSITGSDSIDGTMHIAEAHPTEHTISELFELGHLTNG